MSTKNKPIKRPTVVLDFHALNQEKENSNSNNDSGDDKQVELLKDTKGEASPKISEEIRTIEYEEGWVDAEKTSNSSFSGPMANLLDNIEDE